MAYAPASFRVLVAVDPSVLEELLIALLDEPGVSVVRAGDVGEASTEPFDVVIRNRALASACPAESVIRLTAPTGTGPAVVSTSTGDAEVQIDQLADLRAVLRRLRHS